MLWCAGSAFCFVCGGFGRSELERVTTELEKRTGAVTRDGERGRERDQEDENKNGRRGRTRGESGGKEEEGEEGGGEVDRKKNAGNK